MPLLPKLLQYVRGDARLHEDVATNDARTGIRDRESRSFQRGLDAHAVVDEIGDELSVSQWLIRTAHDSEANVDVPSFNAGIMVWKGRFRRRDLRCMPDLSKRYAKVSGQRAKGRFFLTFSHRRPYKKHVNLQE